MFRSRVFGGTPDSFHLACEYGPSNVEGGGIPTPVSLARMELDWTSAESETQVVERFVQRQSAVLLEQADERVALQLSWEPMAHAADFPNQRLSAKIRVSSAPPVLRSLHFSRTSGSGAAPESLMTALLQHMDLSSVWKLRASEGFPPHFWAGCTDAQQWRSLFNLNLSSCGLVALPSAIGQLVSLHVLRLNHNKLTSLPQELGHLSELEVLSINHNQLTTLPAELRRCSSLRELHLEYNRLVTPLLDLTHATSLASLQLYGNPLEYLPELAPAVGLRSLSLANVRILADTAYSRWEVEVTAPSSSYTSMMIGGRGHKLQPLFNLVFRRSSVQHPLLAGAMSRLMEEPSNLELLVREDVALQQLVLASMGNNPLVVQHAVSIMSAVGAYAGAAQRLVKHNVVRAITGMLASGDKSLQLSGLRVLSSLAAGAAEGELPGEVLVPTALLDKLLDLIRAQHTHQQVRCAALHALGNSAFDASNRRRYLQSPGLMQLLVMMAAAPDSPAPPPSDNDSAGLSAGAHQGGQRSSSSSSGSAAGSVQAQQTAEAEGTTAASPPVAAATPSDTQPAACGQQSSGRAQQPAASSDAVQADILGAQPIAPNPYSSAAAATEEGSTSPAGAAAPAAAGEGEARLSASPPTLTMSRAPSTTGNSATPGERAAIVAAAADSDGSGGGGSSSDALSPPRKALAAAAGVAAAATAAGGDGVAPTSSSCTPPTPAAAATAQPTTTAQGTADKKGSSSVPAGAATEAILPKRRLVAVNNPVKLQAIRLLGILGQNEQVRIALGQPPIRGRGLRVLAMDGGGMKGMAMVELLRQMERRAGAPIWTLFDIIGGTSTGGLLAVSLGVLRLNLDACQEMYTSLGNKVFNQSTAVQEDAGWRDNLYRMYTSSASNMRVAVYGSKHDAANYEELLRRFCKVTELGCASDRLIDTAVMGGPKVFVVATLASSRPAAPFAFRNYELPDEASPIAQQLSACGGSCKHHVWEAVRASSAAPYYLDDFLTADGKRFQDGATTANNPTVVALQQARLLHPQLPVDCVVSLGCGSEPRTDRSKGLSAVIDTGAVLLESATSTDRVHEALATTLQLVPGCQYFRFNAVDGRCNMELDDIRPESWSRLMSATSDYCSQPAVAAQFERLAALLKQGTPAAAAAVTTGATGSTAGHGGVVGIISGSRGRGGGGISSSNSSDAAKAQQQVHGASWPPSSKPTQHQLMAQQHQHHQLQQQTGQLLLGNSLLPRGLDGSGQQQHQQPQQQYSGQTDEAMEPAVLQALQRAAANDSPSKAPRLLYQRGLLLVQARREVAPVAAAAAAAQGVSLAALQQQEFVAQLLAAALPQELLCCCDLSEATAALAAAAPSAAAQQGSGHEHMGRKQQQPSRLQEVASSGSRLSHSELARGGGEPSPKPLRHGSGSGSYHMPAGAGASESAAAASASAAAHKQPKQQQHQHVSLDGSDKAHTRVAAQHRASDTGVTPLSSPQTSSWLNYIFPFSGASGSAGNSPRHQSTLNPNADGTSQAPGELTAAATTAAGGGAAVRLPQGAWAGGGGGGGVLAGAEVGSSVSPPAGGRRGAAAAASGAQPGVPRRVTLDTHFTGGSIHPLQSSPDLQQDVVSPGGSLLKIKSLPAQHHHSPQHYQGMSDGVIRSSSHSPVQGAGLAATAAAGGQHAGSNHRLHGASSEVAAELGGTARGGQQQQRQQAAQGSAAVSEALRQQLLSAAGRVGVVHLALHATDAGLVAGWQQQLTALVEPGPEAQQLLGLLDAASGAEGDRGSGCSRLSDLVASRGHVLAGPQGALVAVLAQQQVLAPLPVSGTHSSGFVSSWLLQLTVPDSQRMLGVGEVWPLLSQLQQLIVVSSSFLPKALVHVLLRGGVAAVVCGTGIEEVAALEAADVAEFFRVFYAEGLWQGRDVVEALQAAIAAVPAVGDSAYECYQLM